MNYKKSYTGACLCGKVRFEITGDIEDIIYCHCSLCRKAQGSAFATNGNVNATQFKFISGENLLTEFEVAPGQTKYFCRICGSPMISKNIKNTEKVRVRLGVIESHISEKPAAHIFVNSKANWEKIEGDLPQFEEYK